MNEGQPTNWEPKKQHPEEVADGLREAFRQAIKDGVIDAIPYLKQMTYQTDIQKTEAEIKVLQKKLELLKEIETHKSQPRMEFGFGGKFEIVFYNDKEYLRLEFTDGSHNWYERNHTSGVAMSSITDGETRRLLEGVWFNDVKRGGSMTEPLNHKLEVVDENTVKIGGVEYKKVEKPKPITLQRIIEECMFSLNREIQLTLIEHILDRVEVEFFPKLQQEAGYMEVYYKNKGWNNCLKELKGRLRE